MRPTPDNAPYITGMGIVSALGSGVDASFAALDGGGAPPAVVPELGPLDRPVFAVPDLPHDGPDGLRTVLLTRAALTQALAAAGLEPPLGPRVAVCLGTTVACQLNSLDFYRHFRAGEAPPLAPVRRFLAHNLADVVAADCGAEGPRLTVANACASGADAIGVALSLLQTGQCDVAVAGGADELSRIALDGFNALGLASPEPCRPYDRDRQGLNLGEGAGILVLETPEHARRRGRLSSLRLLGYGAANDAFHLTGPRPDGTGLETAIRVALARADVSVAAVAFVNVHGTATRENDVTEGRCLARIFGPDIAAISTKGCTGHTLGAAGAIEAILTAAAVTAGRLPRTVGFANPDPEIPMQLRSGETVFTGTTALSTSLAFGGSNAALVIRYEEVGE